MTLPNFELPLRTEPLVLIWPDDGNPVAFWSFATSEEWRTFVSRLSLDPRIPDITRLKFERAQKLFLLGWLDVDLMKGAELVALTALELALTDFFSHVVPRIPGKKIDPSSSEAMMAQPNRYSFKALLKHLIKGEGHHRCSASHDRTLRVTSPSPTEPSSHGIGSASQGRR